MMIVKHRCNTLESLDEAGFQGVEIDLRSDFSKKGKIHLAHDAWATGPDFEVWLEKYAIKKFTGPLILNTKEDGLEPVCLELLRKFKIANFFFLDTTIPTMVQWSEKGIKNFAVRYSQFENLDFVLGFQGRCHWLWADCFFGLPPDLLQIQRLNKSFKICLVSPELQGKTLESGSPFLELKSQVHAICTKSPADWLSK